MEDPILIAIAEMKRKCDSSQANGYWDVEDDGNGDPTQCFNLAEFEDDIEQLEKLIISRMKQ